MSEPVVKRRGLLLVLSSPSGAGKTTISRRLLASENNLTLSVSATTRPMRPGEKDGVDYHFVGPERFESMIRAGEFLEHATVFGNRYGTPRAPVEAALDAGGDILFDIDWQGAQQLTDTVRSDLVKVFILPPSAAVLRDRLERRASDPPDVVAGRMAAASGEMSHWAEYDHVVINSDLEASVEGVTAILHAERLRRQRQTGLGEFVNRLRAELEKG